MPFFFFLVKDISFYLQTLLAFYLFEGTWILSATTQMLHYKNILGLKKNKKLEG